MIIVDDDIDPHSDRVVEWAMATRFQADRGIVVFEDQPSSSLDPSARHQPGKKALGAKLGIDATAPRKGEEFRRVAYPPIRPERLRRLLGNEA